MSMAKMIAMMEPPTAPRRPQGQNALTAAQVVEMRELRVSGVSIRELSTQYNITYQTAWELVTGRIWRGAGGPIDKREPAVKRRRRFSDAHVIEIRKSAATGESYTSLAERYDVEPSTIRRICIGISYGDVAPDLIIDELPRQRTSLTPDQVREIRRVCPHAVSYSEMGRRLGVSHGAIREAALKLTHKQVV